MKASSAPAVAAKLDPLHTVANIESSSQEDVDKWMTCGLDAIRKGNVGIILLAGGQGTRLGFDKPKGMYNIGLPSKKSVRRCVSYI